MSLTLDVARAECERAGVILADLNGAEAGFCFVCPLCSGQVTVTADTQGEAHHECSNGCDRTLIGDELFSLQLRAPQASEDLLSPVTSCAPTGWLDGAPMDPAAEVPEPLPSIPGFSYLHAGAGALLVGPTGTGRSSLMGAGAYDAAAAGLRVGYLGSEVTEAEFNARAADLASRRGDTIDDGLRFVLSRVRYLDLARVIALAWDQPDAWVRDAVQFDVVVIDPLSAVASALDLDFDTSNAEFVRFYDRLVQPLVAAGVAVVMLENIGHSLEARSRAKGASAKQDRADLTFACKLTAHPVGLIVTAHKIRSVRAPFRRGDSWVFDRDTQRIEPHRADEDSGGSTFRPTEIMDRVRRAVEDTPGLSRTALRKAVQGKNEYVGLAIDLLVAEGAIEVRETDGDRGHFRGHPSPPANDGPVPARPPHSYAVPDASPVPPEGLGPPVPSPKDGGPGTGAHDTGPETCPDCGAALTNYRGSPHCHGCATKEQAV